MRFAADGHLIVADAYMGLLSVDVEQRTVTTLVREVNGQPLLFCNDLDIDDDGTIYFSDSSNKFQRRAVTLEMLEMQARGRLLQYSPNTNTTTVLAEGIPFANGVQLTHNGTALLLASTSRARVLRFDLQTRQMSVFVDALPGPPDNIRGRSNGKTYFIALSSKRAAPFSLWHSVAPYPFIRAVIASVLPPHWLTKLMPRAGLLAEVDENGTLLRTLCDISGRTAWISAAEEIGEYLYLGSWHEHHVARIPLSVIDNPTTNTSTNTIGDSSALSGATIAATERQSTAGASDAIASSSSAGPLKLYYFNGRGRAEQIRILLHELGVEFEDIDASKHLADMKKQGAAVLPFGSLPMLQDGEYRIVQGFVIAGYLARKYGLVDPQNIQLAARADAIAAGAEDLRIQYYKVFFGESTPATHEKFVTEVLRARWLPNLNTLLKLNSESHRHFVGHSLTHADTCVFDVLLTCLAFFKDASLYGFPELQHFFAAMQERPRIKAYLSSEHSRPVAKRKFD
eukprot:TRINITY_DN4564_c1_g1_i3.p1 TRINITY_DN4564_c1_g1~~TRINITY_DN4564_c1_g1_i3.p1  ORF type:complete len:512 (+),score=123.24 TRINITY_DN4564_c1_g1_i3:230-1765(+)